MTILGNIMLLMKKGTITKISTMALRYEMFRGASGLPNFDLGAKLANNEIWP